MEALEPEQQALEQSCKAPDRRSWWGRITRDQESSLMMLCSLRTSAQETTGLKNMVWKIPKWKARLHPFKGVFPPNTSLDLCKNP